MNGSDSKNQPLRFRQYPQTGAVTDLQSNAGEVAVHEAYAQLGWETHVIETPQQPALKTIGELRDQIFGIEAQPEIAALRPPRVPIRVFGVTPNPEIEIARLNEQLDKKYEEINSLKGLIGDLSEHHNKMMEKQFKFMIAALLVLTIIAIAAYFEFS